MDASIGVKIGAEYQGAVAGFNAVASAASGMGNAVKDTGEKFAFTNNLLNQSTGYAKQQAVAMKQAADAIKTIPPVANDAANALDKIGGSSRGILEPLNNAYNVIRKIAYALPGIGISGIFLLLGQSIADAFGKAEKSTDDANEALEAYQKTVDQVVSSNSKEAAIVDVLVGKIQSGTLSRQQTVQAIKELQQIAPDYFGKLDAESAKIQDVTRAYGAYNNQIVKTIEAQIRIAEITDLVKQRLDESAKLPDASKFIADLQAQGKTLEEINAIVVKGVGDDIRAQAQLAQSTKGITDEQSKQLLLQSKVPAGVQTILSLLQKEQDILKEIGGTEITSLVKLDAIKPEKIDDPKIKLNGIKFQLDLSTADISIDVSGSLESKHIDKTFLGQIQDQLVASLGAGPSKEFEKTVDNFKKAVANDVIGLGEGIFEDIGKAFGGAKNPFANILDLLGGFLEDFGKQLIVLGGLSQLIQDLLPEIFTPAGAGTAIVVGALAIAAGALFKSLSSKKGPTAFAEGGIVTGPTNALIGEAGPEVVFPLDKLNKFIRNNGSSPNMNVSGQCVLRNQDLGLAVQRGQRNQSFVS